MMDDAMKITLPLIEQVLPDPDSIVPAFTNHVPILGPLDDHPTPMEEAPTELGTAANVTVMPLVDNDNVPLANEMSGNDVDTDMGEANVDEAVHEEDAFDLHFSTTGGLVSLKMLFLIK